jgi:hypothetical protein
MSISAGASQPASSAGSVSARQMRAGGGLEAPLEDDFSRSDGF